MAEKKFLDLLGLQKYDEKIKAYQAAADAEVLEGAKGYADSLADNYDAAGTAATKMQELADGAVSTNATGIAENKAAIEKLNGDAATDGSVAKAIADAKALIDDDVDAVEKKAADNESNIADLTDRMDAAEEDIDAMQEDIGNVDSLSTTSKTLSGAINEVLAAVGSGGTAAVIAVNAKGSTDDYAQVYEITQGGVSVGTINIPKDMVVESGEVVDVDGVKNIKLVLQNVESPLYIPVGSLVDIYVAKAEAAQVQIAIDSATREISAHIVSGSVTATELAANAVITEKIADKNVTKAKLSTEVQASLDKADVALDDAKAYTDGKDSAMDLRVKAVEDLLSGSGEGTVEEKIEAAKVAAIEASAADATSKANTAEANAKTHASDLNTAMAERMAVVEGAKHTHTNKELLDTYTQTEDNLADAVAKKHEHSNANVLNGVTEDKVELWDTVSSKVAQSDFDSLSAKFDGHAHSWNDLTDKPFGGMEVLYEWDAEVEYSEVISVIAAGGVQTNLEKISDDAPEHEHLIGKTINVWIDASGEPIYIPGAIDSNTIVLSDGAYVVSSAILVVTVDSFNFNGVAVPRGVWGVNLEAGGQHFTKIQIVGQEKQLDEKYIPDTIARTENLTTLESSLNTAISGKVAQGDFNSAVERLDALELIDHDHSNKAELDLIVSGDKAKWDAAQANAEATAASALESAKTELEGKIADGDKANKDLIDAHASRIEALEAIDHDHSNKDILDSVTAEKVAAWDAAEANAKTDASNKDAVVLAEAQKCIAAVQGALDTHAGNADIHVAAADKTKWNDALQASDITVGATDGTIAVKGVDVAVKGLGSAAYVATTAFDASGSADQALTDANAYTDAAFAKFVEVSEEEINALFA